MTVTCPRCGRFLAEGTGYVRVICAGCKTQVQVTPPEVRRQSA